MEITVWSENKKKVYECHEGESLYDTFVRYDKHFSAPCGGKGKCLKCIIQIIDGEIPITKADERAFTKEELKNGFRLACKAKPKTKCEIRNFYGRKKKYGIVTEFQAVPAADKNERKSAPVGTEREFTDNNMKKKTGKNEVFIIAIDIGTTTIAMQVNKGADVRIVRERSIMNPQRIYGADVMARIRASIDGEKEKLTKILRSEMEKGMDRLVKEADIKWPQIAAVVITGNTAMLHFLLGYPTDSLSKHPFKPKSIKGEEIPYHEIFRKKRKARLMIMPGISAFIGADIMAGILALEIHKREEITLLVDLGTNGEMVLGNQQKLLCTSTAAGPAFEGGNITWGTASVEGAVCSVNIDENGTEIKTIMDGKAIGICGTGIIEALSEFLRCKIMDETGLLREPYFEEGVTLAATGEGRRIRIYQKDIRELQMAKAAVAAGIKTLVKAYGIRLGDITNVYLAGGFGYQLNIEKAMGIGLLPKELKNKVIPVGNSALRGAVLYGLSEGKGKKNKKAGKAACRKIVKITEEIYLGEDSYFKEHYIDEMNF